MDAPCDCVPYGEGGIEFCPLHEAAPALLEALEAFAHVADVWDAKPPSGLDEEFYALHTSAGDVSLSIADCRKARAAIAQAKGEIR